MKSILFVARRWGLEGCLWGVAALVGTAGCGESHGLESEDAGASVVTDGGGFPVDGGSDDGGGRTDGGGPGSRADAGLDFAAECRRTCEKITSCQGAPGEAPECLSDCLEGVAPDEPACETAYASAFACIASLDCDDIEDLERGICASEIGAVEDVCATDDGGGMRD